MVFSFTQLTEWLAKRLPGNCCHTAQIVKQQAVLTAWNTLWLSKLVSIALVQHAQYIGGICHHFQVTHQFVRLSNLGG